MMCGRSFYAAEGKEPVEGRGVMDGAKMLELMSAQRWVIASDTEDDERM